MADDDKFMTAVNHIREADQRYRPDAYAFLNDAVAYTVRKYRESDPERKSRHVSGRELIYGAVELASKEFGVLAPLVFREWGVTTGSAIGDIVFHLIREGIMTASSEDSREDFNVVGPLDPLFPRSFDTTPPSAPPKIV